MTTEDRYCLNCCMPISGGLLCDGCEAVHFSGETGGTGPIVSAEKVRKTVLCYVRGAAKQLRALDSLGLLPNTCVDDEGVP